MKCFVDCSILVSLAKLSDNLVLCDGLSVVGRELNIRWSGWRRREMVNAQWGPGAWSQFFSLSLSEPIFDDIGRKII